jgi:hypothetical protein
VRSTSEARIEMKMESAAVLDANLLQVAALIRRADKTTSEHFLSYSTTWRITLSFNV